MGNNIKIYHEELGWGSLDWIALAKKGAGGGRGNGIKHVIDTVPRNVGCQSSNDALQHPGRTKTKRLKRSNAISGYIQAGEAILWTETIKISGKDYVGNSRR